MIVLTTAIIITAITTTTITTSTLSTTTMTRGKRKNKSTEMQMIIDEH